MGNGYQVEMRGISKSFGGVKALQDVDFCVRKGEIHGLIGENGAGKSTLMKILGGAVQKDAGEILIEGRKVNISDPRTARRLGIAVIYQELALAPDLSVAENIFLGRLSSTPFIKWEELHQKASELIEGLGFNIDPRHVVGELSVAHQQVVEICKALSENSRVLVLDEPSAVLATQELQKLFHLLLNLKERGVSIVYISHRLEEVLEITDTITVLKDGKKVGTVKSKNTDKEELIQMMIGRTLESMFPSRHAKVGQEVLRVEHLKCGRRVQDVSLTVREGEVVGIAGLVGAGRTETARAIFGADKKDEGRILIGGKPVLIKSPSDSVRNGLGLLPEDRKTQGVVLSMPVKANITMSSLRRITSLPGWISHRKENIIVDQIIERLRIKTNSPEQEVSELSGGNQQKVAVSKWLAAECKVIILDEPTRGVDVGAKVEIYRLINELAERGMGVLMISSEIPELIGMCDRVIVMREGRVVGEISQNELSEERIFRLAIGG
ncbi:MAG: sugar ABC transporter ATP-binding protein [Thermoanaerobacteraceae bacterium]|nr:sugar ABC transporter ATP-binding protein [Thermoanaerobacteraceae bacterium]